MVRILFFLVLVFLLGLGFAWLADRPGNLVVTFAGYQYQVTLMVAAMLVAGLVFAVMLSWWLVKSIIESPYTVSRYFRVRRRDRGYQALSTGMIAAGSGDAALARKKKKEAMKLLSADQEPLIHLLDAQASLLEGDHEAARRKFEAMVEDPETRLLGLRGLYLEAERHGDRTAARHYASRAIEAAPHLGWAADVALEQHCEAGEWDEALRIVSAQKSTHQIEKDTANRRKAVLLTAKAIEVLEADPAGAKTAALEATRLAPDLVPAAATAARAALRLGDVRKAAKILETSWKHEPHPEVADVYIHARPGDSTHDRLERAKKLQALRTNNAESSLAVARAALDAGEFPLARREVEAAIRLEPREGAYLLLADIEEAETGNQGKVRQWLGKAVRAPRDPAWVADGYVAERWAPFSPVTGKFDAFSWRAPSERLGQLVEAHDSAQETPATAPLVIAASSSAPKTAAEPVAKPVLEDAIVEPVSKPVPSPSTVEEKPQPAPAPHLVDIAAPKRDGAAAQQIHLPDDPGVDPDDKQEIDDEPRRFRLF
jgi:HemY protein